MVSNQEIQVLNKQDLTKPISNVKAELPKYWERDYINERIDRISNNRHRVFLQFLWHTGVRVTEAVNVRKQDIDLNNYTIQVRWLKSRKWNYRNIPLHPNLRDILMLYTASMKSDELVFPISRQRAWQLVKKYMRGHPHQFRHSFAVNWLRCGGDIVVLSRMLGHSKIQSTMEYLKIVPIDTGKELLKVVFK
jgi:integrase